MMKYKLKLLFVLTVFLFSFFINLAGCVNYDQNTTINEDGSGSMKIHYWSSMKNFSMGTALGKFEFDEEKAKDKYKSSNTEVTNIKVEDKLDDSTKNVFVELTFKDINKLNDAKGFESVKVTWKEVTDGMELKYTLLMDTTAAKNISASNYTITYEFKMPSEVVSTNGTKDGQTIKYNYSLADLSKDIEMITVVKKSDSKFCGLFGIIAGSTLIGFSFYSQRRKRKNT